MSVLQCALTLAEEYGFPVFPCRPRAEIINGKEKKAKSPYTTNGFKDATCNSEQIDEWWAQLPDALVAVPTGHTTKLLVIDIDLVGAEWYTEHSVQLGCGRVHKTRRGHHLLYRMPPDADIRNSTSKIAPGVDVRAIGGYAIWWPAIGLDAVGDLAELTEPPKWLLDQLLSKSNGKGNDHHHEEHHHGDGDDACILEGGRNDALTRLAGKMRRANATAEELTAALLTFNSTRCRPRLSVGEVYSIVASVLRYEPAPEPAISVNDFRAYMPMHQYIFVPNRELWPASSVNARVAPIQGQDGKPISPSVWLDGHHAVEQMTWAPGKPTVIEDRLVANGGWIERPGCRCFNLYLPPAAVRGDSTAAGPWLDHVRFVYPDDADHIVKWLAHRVQRPDDKINHALALGGPQGIGKDTLLEPVKYAIGPWNFNEVSPTQLMGRFNSFIKSVILRISEARDLGDVDRYAFYDHMKVYTAAPPDVLRCDEKHLREHSVMNICGVIITSNHKTDGIYLPSDDRRHYVAWSTLTKEAFGTDYWRILYRWYAHGGNQHVAAYLSTLDLSGFDPKAPPPKTPAFWDIVDANRAPEDAELADVLDVLGNPAALTLADLQHPKADPDFRAWLLERKNRRQIPHRLEAVGYIPVRYDGAEHGLWTMCGRRQAIYGRKADSVRDRTLAARQLVKDRELRQ